MRISHATLGDSLSNHILAVLRMRAAPLLVFALALGLRVAAIASWQFRGLYGQDSYAYYDYSLALRAAWLQGQPIPNFFWPLAYPLLFVAASFLFGANPFAGQLVSLLAGALSATFAFLTAQEIARLAGLEEKRAIGVAWMAALWIACSAELIQYSIVVMADALGLALAICSAWLLARYLRTEMSRWLYLSAAVLALAFLARIEMALLIFPWAGVTLLAWKRQGSWQSFLKKGLWDGVFAVGIGVLIVLPYLLWAWRNMQAGLPSYIADPGFAQWSPQNFLRREFDTPDGHLQFPYPSGIYYAVAVLRGGALTPLVIPFFILGVSELWRRRAVNTLVFLLGWAAAIYLFIGGMPWQNLRFAFPLYPPIAILGAIGLGTISGWQPSRAGLHAVAAAVILVVQLTLGYFELDKFMTTTRGYLEMAEWVKRELPADATLIAFTATATLEHETDFKIVEIFFETPDTLSARLRGEHNYLLLDLPSVETQWAGRAPALNYQFLRDRIGLEEIGTRLTYTLYHIK